MIPAQAEVFLYLSAADSSGGASDALPGPLQLILPYLNLGVFVLLCLALVLKWGLVPKWVLDEQKRSHDAEIRVKDDTHRRELAARDAQITQLTADREELKQTNNELQNLARDRLLPALIESSRLAAAYVSELQRRSGQGGGGNGP